MIYFLSMAFAVAFLFDLEVVRFLSVAANYGKVTVLERRLLTCCFLDGPLLPLLKLRVCLGFLPDPAGRLLLGHMVVGLEDHQENQVGAC